MVFAALLVCLSTWFVIEKTSLGARLRAGTGNPKLVEAFGVIVPLMGSNLIIVVFAVVVIGGMGTLAGPVLGAFLVVALENKLGDVGGFLAEATHVEWFASLGESVGIVTGLIFVACVLLFRRGIVGEIGAMLGRAGRKRSA